MPWRKGVEPVETPTGGPVGDVGGPEREIGGPGGDGTGGPW